MQSPGMAMNNNQLYSPMPKMQSMTENSVIGKQAMGVLQQRSPVKVNGSSNTQSLVEELNQEKEKHRNLSAKLKKLEQQHKGQNTQFLNDLERKIKSLIQ